MGKTSSIIETDSDRSRICQKIWKNNQANNRNMALMKKKEHFITFSINKKTKIIIPLRDPIEYLGPIYEEDILLFHYDHEIILSDLTIYHNMIDLADILKKALNKELLLDNSITKDIGYIYNNYHHDSTNFTMHTFQMAQ